MSGGIVTGYRRIGKYMREFRADFRSSEIL